MALFSKKDEEKEEKVQTDSDDDVDRIQKGQIKSRLIIEILGRPKDVMEKAFNVMLDKLKEEENTHVISVEVADLKEHDDKLWGTFAEVELWSDNFTALTAVLFEYFPSSVEVLEPTSLNIRSPVISNYLNDIQSRLHDSDMSVKNLRFEVDHLKKIGAGFLNNLLLLALKDSSKSVEELSKVMGMSVEELKPYLKRYAEKNKIIQKGEKYSLAVKK